MSLHLLHLIEIFRPASSLDEIEYYVKLLNSNIGASKLVPDQHHTSNVLRKKLLAMDGTAKMALDFSRAVSRLKTTKVNEILYFLNCLTNAKCQETLNVVTITGAMPKMTVSKVECKNGSGNVEQHQVEKSLWRPMKPMEPFSQEMIPQFQGYYQVGKNVPHESQILRDLLYVFQGVEGRLLKYSSLNDKFLLDSNYNLPRPTIQIVNELAEIGWVYFKITKGLDSFKNGLISQAFSAAIKDELVEFDRLIAILENDLFSTCEYDHSFATVGLSLKRLYVWSQGPIYKLRFMLILLQACQDTRGSGILSVLHRFSNHGDPFIQTFIKKILPKVSVPFFEILYHWVQAGELHDPCLEFCIQLNQSPSDFWKTKYVVHMDLIPTFLSVETIKKILVVGKSLNFLYLECKEIFPMSKTMTERDFTFDNLENLLKYVDSIYQKISSHVLNVLNDKYMLTHHLEALKKYLLLGQGDFIQYLMDAIGDDLSKDARVIYRHNLTGGLETAIRSSNAQFENADILARLDVRLLEVSEGDSGWDVFSIDYHIDGPLSTVITTQAMHAYHRLFAFLWRLKRVEHILSSSWKDRMSNLSGIKGNVLHKCRILWTEMTHFIYQLEYYILFEVLELSWRELTDSFNSFKDLDDLITAHNHYLNQITLKGLLALNGNEESLSQKLVKLFNIIFRFKKSHNDMMEGTLESDSAVFTVQKISDDFHAEFMELLETLSDHKDQNLRLLGVRLDFNQLKMSKLISAVFADKARPVFVAYVTAGYPQKSVTVEVLLELQNGGADIIELGVPFSDPIADGPAIQESSFVALENGIDLEQCFKIVEEARSKGLYIPIVLMGYYNPFMIYGEEKLVKHAALAGVDGFIVVDLPIEEAHNLRNLASMEGLSFIPLIAPTSSDERIRQVADIADSFIYVVSTLGVTGSRASVDSDLPALVQRIKNITQIPLAVGFGVSSRNQFEYVGSIAEGVVIGSRLINLLKNTPIEIVGNAIQEFSLQVTNRKKEDILKSIDSLQKIQRSPNTPNIMTKVSSDVNGRYGDFGGRYVAELLVGCLDEIEQEFEKCMNDPGFWDEFRSYYQFMGRPSPLHLAERLSKDCGGAKIWLKREDLNHTGSHKINNAVGQVLLAKRLGKKRIIAETGAGQHGVATATVCAKLGLECVIYMGASDVKRQALNVFRIRLLGAKVIPVESGSRTLKDAINEAMRDWVTNVRSTHYLVGSAIGPHPFPKIVREFQSVIGRETKEQMMKHTGRLPDAVIACVGGGSNAIGMFAPFVNDPNVRIIGVEAGGDGIETGRHSATLSAGKPGVLHGTKTYLLQDSNGQVIETHSISAGLDYPGVGPEHAMLKDSGRAEYISASDTEALKGFKVLSQLEGIIPALETSHAIFKAIEIASSMGSDRNIVINVSGRGDKDVVSVAEALPKYGDAIGWYMLIY